MKNKRDHIKTGNNNMKSFIFIILLLIFSRCEPYTILRPITANMENQYRVLDRDYFILMSDTIKVKCLAFYSDTDSMSRFVVIELLTMKDERKWENSQYYSLFDKDSIFLKPTSVKRLNQNNSSDNFNFGYEIIFKTDEEIKCPLKFCLSTPNQKEYFILFSW